MTPGVYPGISIQDYHSGPGLSFSTLSMVRFSLAHARVPQEQTAAMLEGSDFHAMALEGADPEYKHTPLKLKMLQGMVDAVRQSALSQRLIQGSVEQSVFWHDPVYPELLCKARPDVILWGADTLVDLKSTSDASPEGFAKAVARYHYHGQAAWFLDGMRAAKGREFRHFVFLCVEKTPPYAIAAYRLDDEAVYQGGNQCREWVDTWMEGVREDKWPGYPETIQPLSLPRWAMPKEDYYE